MFLTQKWKFWVEPQKIILKDEKAEAEFDILGYSYKYIIIQEDAFYSLLSTFYAFLKIYLPSALFIG